MGKITTITTNDNLVTYSIPCVITNGVAKIIRGKQYTLTACSSDGTIIIVANAGGYVYKSIDSGETWKQLTSAGIATWAGVACNDSGLKILAADISGYCRYSEDGGVTWFPPGTLTNIRFLQLSSNKQNAIAIPNTSPTIYCAFENNLSTWNGLQPSQVYNATSGAISNNGANIAIATAGPIFTSSDYGENWIEREDAGIANWASLTASSDGTKIYAGVLNGNIWVSNNGGADGSWTEKTVGGGGKAWYNIVCSPDGSKVLAVAQNFQIFLSTDSGSNWAAVGTPQDQYWYDVAASDDFTKMIACENTAYGLIYKSSNSGTTFTTISNNKSTIIF
jgi:photosystem II stability/assembly factor-like uncharacterized protein